MALAALRGAAKSVSQATGIAQDNVIFAMLLFAFVVWITTKGELGKYLAFFKPGTNVSTNSLGIDDYVTASSTTGSAANPIGQAVSAAGNAGNAIGQATGIQQAVGAIPGVATVKSWLTSPSMQQGLGTTLGLPSWMTNIPGF